MSERQKPEPVQVVKGRRDAMLRRLVDGVPYIGFLGIQFDRRGDERTAVLPFQDMLIGNPMIPALHGGATAAFLEVTATDEDESRPVAAATGAFTFDRKGGAA